MIKIDEQGRLIAVDDLGTGAIAVLCELEEEVKTTKCVHCGQPIGWAVTRCPYCGEEN